MFGIDDMFTGAVTGIGGIVTNLMAKSNQQDAQNFNSAQSALNRQFNHDEAILGREFNAAEAGKSRDWQETMSNSAYQRGVADMRKAGINPLLAYSKGGASSPGGATASGPSASGSAATSPGPPPVTDAIGNAISSAQHNKRVNAEVSNMVDTNENIKQQNKNLKAEEWRTLNEAARVQKDIALKDAALHAALKEASRADSTKEFHDSKIGRWINIIGEAGRAINPFMSSAKSAKSLGD